MKKRGQVRRLLAGAHLLLAMGLTFAMAVLLQCSVTAEGVRASDLTKFPDMEGREEWDCRAVAYVSSLGAMVGNENGNFLPDKEVTRGEMAAILCRMMDQTEGLKPSECFVDVPLGHWANPYVNQAVEMGIVKGYNEEEFGPEDPVTYEQAITMVIRAAGREGEALASGGYPNGFLAVVDRAVTHTHDRNSRMFDGAGVFYKEGPRDVLSRVDVANILYNCMEYRIRLPLMGYNLADCKVDMTYVTTDPNYTNHHTDDGVRLTRISTRVKSSSGLIGRNMDAFGFDKETDCYGGTFVLGPVWEIFADNCPNGSVFVIGTDSNGKSTYAKDANGEKIRILAEDLNFYLNGEYATLTFDIGPVCDNMANSLDDVDVYLDGNQVESFRILYNTAAQHCTLDVTGIQVVTIRVWGDPEHPTNDFMHDVNKIAIHNSVLTK